ncbi:MAG: hypothetical protein IJF31_00020, partial [Clostridia bacterium]|nr:hypothetical protein [Clostridia bacterium]
MRKIRIAHIGCNKNSHAPQIFTSLKEQSELFEIVGYTLPEDEGVTGGAERLAKFQGYREMVCFLTGNDLFGVTLGRNDFLCDKSFTASATLLTICQTGFGAGRSLTRNSFLGMAK